jgi:hypothetical protein
METLWPWLVLSALGAFHGLNPGMGWLFAVALGLQERSRKAVLGAFGPIALGHAASVAAVVAVVGLAQAAVDAQLLRYIGAGALISFGIYKLVAPLSHPRWVGMRVHAAGLVLWSFLMATAHGAGLMLLPVLLRLQALPASHEHAAHDHTALAVTGHMASAGLFPTAELVAVALHTAAMFAVMAAMAVLVYEKLGVAVLRRAWLNLDLIWAGALVLAGVLSLLLA